MRSTSGDPPFNCVSCEAPISGAPVFHVGLPFCCAGCVADGPCTCSYDEEASTRDHTPWILHAAPAAVADDVRSLVGARG
jgi:hypothetical protein